MITAAPDLLIFDCDGTLVDSEYLNNLATIQILHEEGLTQYDIDYAFDHFVGLRFKRILADITDETGHRFPEDACERYVARVEELAPQYLKNVPGVHTLVAAAAERMKICVASNGQRDSVISSLVMAGLKDYFPDEHIFTAIQVTNPKPAPDLFLYAAQKMNADPHKCLVIEDSVPGVTAAKAAGMKVFGFTGTHRDEKGYGQRLRAAGAGEVHSTLIHIKEEVFG